MRELVVKNNEERDAKDRKVDSLRAVCHCDDEVID